MMMIVGVVVVVVVVVKVAKKDEDDDVILSSASRNKKTGQMDSLTPFWATKSREVVLPDLWANQNGKYRVKQK